MNHRSTNYSITGLLMVIGLLPVLIAGNPAAANESEGFGVDVSGGRISLKIDTDDDEKTDFGLESPRIRIRGDVGKVRFKYRNDNFDLVLIQGNFTDWEPEPMELDDAGEIWSYSCELDPGRYRYQFVVRDEDGEWEAIDPNNSSASRDSEYGWVSKFRVSKYKDRKSRRHRSWSSRSRRANDEIDRIFGHEDGGASYDRVDGFSVFAIPQDIGHARFEPSLAARVKYGFSSKEWSLSGIMAQPLVKDSSVQLLLNVYSETSYTDQTGVGYIENSLAAVCFKEDFRDYYLVEGLTAYVAYNPQRDLRLAVGFKTDDYTSLTNNADWSLSSGSFLENPEIHRGTMRSLYAEGRWGGKYNHVNLAYETCGEGLADGSFEFTQLAGHVRSRLWLGPEKRLDVRIKAGKTLSGWAPNQRQYIVGGLGTVRGYVYQDLLVPGTPDPEYAGPPTVGGQKMFVANAEYTLEAGWDFDLVFFFDTGMAWEDRNASFELNDLRSSAGVGFQLDDGDDGLRVDVIQTLDESGRDTMCQLRMHRMF